MEKTILLIGSTDGIGLDAGKMLVSQGHDVLLHGRSRSAPGAALTPPGALHCGTRLRHRSGDAQRVRASELLAHLTDQRGDRLAA
jgi:NAD(P)-dependent dehydrogenase (short-subunit alcohol dehydrogenase family)